MRSLKLISSSLCLLLSIFVFRIEPAVAGGPVTLTAKFAGTAFASALDLNGDGIMARQFTLPVYDSLPFVALEGFADTGIIALPGQGSCQDPGAIELEPYGTFVIRGRRDNVIYAAIDPSHHLCYNPFAPNELLYFNITGGRGNYEGATGSGTAQLFDAVLMATPEGAPLLVDSQGILTVTISLH